MEVKSSDKTGWWGRPDDSWSLRAKLVIRPDGSDGFSVTAEGTAGNSSAVPDSRVTTAVNAASCSVTLNAGPHRTLTLTCNPTPQAKPPPPPPSREVASQTSHSLIPHLLHQLQLNNNQVVGSELKKTNINKRPNCLKGDGGKKNPRTVHIDVYCTESSDSDEESVSTPRTIYQSDKSKVVHERMSPTSTPHCLRRDRRRELSGSDVVSPTGGSSGYPSRVSSTPWSGYISQESLPDTASTDSLRPVDSVVSLAQTDSFDYENSTDKFRILQKEKEWDAWPQGSWATSEEEESSESSGPELAWSFAEADGGGLRRTDTVRHSSPPSSLSDSDLLKHQTTLDRIPQTFGPIIRRPNRHIGPTKNPNCPCNTCKFYFNNMVSPS